MNDLLDFVIKQHGIDRWSDASTVSATVPVYGGFWAFKGLPDMLSVESAVATVHRQHITMMPFGAGASLEFDAGPDRVRIIGPSNVQDELRCRAVAWPGTPGTRSGRQRRRATSSPTPPGCTCLTFLFTLPGVRTREIEPWSEVGETWRGLEVQFPDEIATHSSVQTYYFDANTGLQRRMDYAPDVNGKPLVAHYTTEHHNFGG